MTKKEEIKKILSKIIQEIEFNDHFSQDPSIENGAMGQALFYQYCAQFYNDNYYASKVEQMIQKAVELLSEISNAQKFTPSYMGDSLPNIISSFGKGLLFLENKFENTYLFKDYYTLIDDALVEMLPSLLKNRDFDFFSGALSIGHYFINQYAYRKDLLSKEILLGIYNALDKEAIFIEYNQVCWKSPAYDDQVYIGLSHGSAMIINFITKLFKFDILSDQNNADLLLLEKAINFVLSQKREIKDGYFPHIIEKKMNNTPTIYALCYGDLGVLYALKSTCSILKKKTLTLEIDNMLAESLKRKKNIALTCDASVLYGASGVYHTLKSLYNLTYDFKYHQAYTYWYDQILTYQNQDITSLAGFENKLFNSEINHHSMQFSFGWGLAGIGISLLQGLDSKLPPLNETLLLGI